MLTYNILCIVVGGLGGLVAAHIGLASLPTGIILGSLYGLGFALLASPRATTPGAGLLWGLAYALLLWLVNPLGLSTLMTGATPDAMLGGLRARFPALVAHLLCFGMPLGVILGTLRGCEAQRGETAFSLPRALLVGGWAGIIGGWAFGKWMAQVNFFPLIAGLVHSTSYNVGVALHFLFALIIGATFGLLFQRDIRGYGSSLGWGFGYGLVWWFLGPLTLLPILQGAPIDWSYVHGAELFGSLIGHIVYGVIVGLLYAFFDRLWVGFFIESDPLLRSPEGAGSQTLRSLGWGLIASLVGGVLFSAVMASTGALSQHGPRRFYVLNTGISTIRALQLAEATLATEGLLLRYTDLRIILAAVTAQVARQEGGTHADEIETSMMLVIAPEMVDMAKAVKDYHPGAGALTRAAQGEGVYSASGVYGDATLATRDKGERLVATLVAGILQDIETLKQGV